MELEYRDKYVEDISKATYSHTLTLGMTLSILIGICSLIVLAILLRGAGAFLIMISITISIIVVVNIIGVLVGRSISRKTLEEASLFVETISRIASEINCDKVELLEKPPPPYTAVLRYGKYYVVISYYSGRGVYVSILEPMDVDYEEGYVPIYLKKSREKLACSNVGGYDVCVYKVVATLPVPLEDKIIEGRFYTYDFMIQKLVSEKIIDGMRKTLVEIERIRSLYPERG